MSAAYLNRTLGKTGCQITLLDSVEPDPDEVCSSAPLLQYLFAMRLDEAHFMRQSNATYKVATQFQNWVQDGSRFWEPIGGLNSSIDGLDLFQFWLKALHCGQSKGNYTDYSLHALLCEQSKAPRPFQGESPVIQSGAISYHVDVTAFKNFLTTLAIGEGVEQVFDSVVEPTLRANGSIESVQTSQGRTFTADLYLDCTGSSGTLIEKALGDPWQSWSDALPLDQAVFLRLPRDEQSPPFTTVMATNEGWDWKLPLSHRLQWGSLTSSQHTLPDQTFAALHENVSQDFSIKGRSAEPIHFQYKNGRRTRFWSANCVSLGSAAGFIDPLLSPPVSLLQRSLGLLLDYFPDREFNPTLSSQYNEMVGKSYQAARDFAQAHYRLSRRPGAVWEQCRKAPLSSTLDQGLQTYLENGRIEPHLSDFAPDATWYSLFAAADQLPRRHATRADVSNFEKVLPIFDQIRQRHQSLADSLPTHRELLETIHRPPL